MCERSRDTEATLVKNRTYSPKTILNELRGFNRRQFESGIFWLKPKSVICPEILGLLKCIKNYLKPKSKELTTGD